MGQRVRLDGQILITETCADCSCVFGMTEDMTGRRRRDGQTFYCPNGHALSFKKTEADRLRTERDRLKQRVAQQSDEIADKRRQVEQERRSKAAYKGQATRLKNKAKAGECPCCQKSYKHLRNHMQKEHPDFELPEVEPAEQE